MNKNGSILDILFIGIALFVFAIGCLIAFTVWEEFKETTNDNQTINWSTSYWSNVERNQDKVSTNWDYIFLFLMIGLTISLILSTFALKSHPVFFVVSILAMAIFLVVAGALSNVYEDIGAEATLADANTEYNIMEYVMDKLPFFLLIIGAIGLVALYAKSRFEGGGGY